MNRSRLLALLLLVVTFAAAQLKPATAQPGDIAQGKKIYNNQCALCHGIGGTGGKGPALNQSKLQHAATLPALIKIIQEGIPGSEMPDFWMLNEKEVRQVAAYVRSLSRVNAVKLPGDPIKGKTLYETKGNCAACHIVRGAGGIAGPELSEIGARRSAAHLREALLEPNAATPEGFLLITVTTADGKSVRGARVNEDVFTIQLRDAAGRFHSFRKTDLGEIKKEFGVSTMPSYKDVFTASELDNLIAYLASLRGTK